MKKRKFEFEKPSEILIASLIHLASVIILMILLTAAFSLFLMSTDDPLAYSSILSFIIMIISVVLCSSVFCVVTHAPALCSLISGLLLSALMISVSALTECQNSVSPLLITALYISTPVLAYLSSLLTLRSREKKKPRFKRRKAYR